MSGQYIIIHVIKKKLSISLMANKILNNRVFFFSRSVAYIDRLLREFQSIYYIDYTSTTITSDN